MPSHRDEVPSIPHRTLWAIGLLVVALLLTLQATGAHQERMDRERNAVVATNVDTLVEIAERAVARGHGYYFDLDAEFDAEHLPGSTGLLNPFTGERSEPSNDAGEGVVNYTALYNGESRSDTTTTEPTGCVVQGYGADGILVKEVILPRRRGIIDESRRTLWPIEKLAISYEETPVGRSQNSSGGDMNAF